MSDSTKLIASKLREARETGGLVEQHVVTSLTDLEQAYEIQSTQIARYAEEAEGIIGWKIGPTSEAKLVAYGIEEPLIAPVFASKCHADGARIPIYMPHRPKLEAEVALLLKTDIDARLAAGGRSAVSGAIEAALPAIEIVGFRYVEPESTAVKIVADGGGNAGVVVGDTTLPFAELAGLTIDVTLDGDSVASGGVDALLWDDVLDAVVWLAQHAVLKNRGLQAGDIVFTGACTSLVPLEPGQQVSVDFGGLTRLTAFFSEA